MYVINYLNGACQWTSTATIKVFVSLIESGSAISVIDVKNKKALIMNVNSEGKNIGWASIPEFAAHSDEDISNL